MDGPDLEELIRLRYPAGEWALIFELSKGTGYEGAGGRINFHCCAAPWQAGFELAGQGGQVRH